MNKSIVVIVMTALAALSLTGCKAENVQTFTYGTEGITSIEIETGANDVQLIPASGDKIEVSYTDDVASVKDGVLSINIPMPGGGVNFKEPSAVLVGVPDMPLESVHIKSEAGNVQLDGANANKLTVNVQNGNVTLSGTEGNITAKSEMDSIITELPIADNITNAGTVGQELNGQIGDSQNVINLYTNTGVIEIK